MNRIIDFAESNQFNWVLTLDQDSVCREGLIAKYTEFITNNRQEINIGCLTCNINDRNFLSDSQYSKDGYQRIDYCITSGTLMNVRVTKEIGGFDNKMFIDKVDCDICINFKLHNYEIIKINYVGLLHEIGHAKQINLCFRKWELYNHSPLRRYYMCKNSIYLLKKYHNWYVTKIFMKEIFHTILVFCFEDNKKEKIKAGLKGFRDEIL